jgi:hypothetical protein
MCGEIHLDRQAVEEDSDDWPYEQLYGTIEVNVRLSLM